MLTGMPKLQAWNDFSAFEVFGDYMPMAGFRMVVKVEVRPDQLGQLLGERSEEHDLLDPELALSMMRAGLGLVGSGLVSFAYATCEGCLVVIRPDLQVEPGHALLLENRIVSMFASRLSLLVGREFQTVGQIFEFPDIQIIRRALSRLVEAIEENTPLRSSLWLGSQLRGRGQTVSPTMFATLEEQTSLLTSHGIDMDALPSWWWRGIAAAIGRDGSVQVSDELPHGDEFGALIPD